MIQIFGTAKCKTTRKAQRFFTDRRIPFQFIDLKQRGPSRGEIASVARAVGSLRALVDTDGKRWRDRGPRFSVPSDDRLTALLVDEPLLLRTPIVRRAGAAAVGLDEEVWRAFAADEGS